jgi:hypothetical protein
MLLPDGVGLAEVGDLEETFDVDYSESITLLDGYSGNVTFNSVNIVETIELLDSFVSGKFPAEANKRQILIPPYLKSNPIFTDFVLSIDSVWKDAIDNPIDNIKKLRYLYIPSEDGEDKITNGELLKFTDFNRFERDILVRQANLLGFSIQESSFLSEDDYLRLYRNISSFWFEKGRETFIDFIAFCLNAEMHIFNLWSYNYVVFEQASSAKDVDLDHTTGGYASVAHSTNQTPASTLTLEWMGSLDDYTDNDQTLVSKYGAAGNIGYRLYVNNTGNVVLDWSTDGTAVTTEASTAALTTTDGETVGIRAEIRLNSGGNYDVKFFTSTNFRIWTQLGTTVQGVGTTSVFSSTAALAAGAANAGAVDPAVGITKRARVTVDGVIRGDFEGIFGGVGGSTSVDRLGNSWTITAPAALAQQSVMTAVWDGGSWYPTTHVDASFSLPGSSGVTEDVLRRFFYEFSNYDLVLRNLIPFVATEGKATVQGVGSAVISAVGTITGTSSVSGDSSQSIDAIGIGVIGMAPIGGGI